MTDHDPLFTVPRSQLTNQAAIVRATDRHLQRRQATENFGLYTWAALSLIDMGRTPKHDQGLTDTPLYDDLVAGVDADESIARAVIPFRVLAGAA